MKVAVIGVGHLPTTILKESEKGVVVEVEQPRGISIMVEKDSDIEQLAQEFEAWEKKNNDAADNLI